MEDKLSDSILQTSYVSDRIFVFHPDFLRSNFYSQQLRALALVEGLQEHGFLNAANRSVTVIGTGIAGLTVAAALATRNANVRIIDPKRPLERYRNAVHRELHPNIIFWPFQELRAITNLPFLNWSCGPCSQACDQIMAQWNADFAKIVPINKEEAQQIDETENGVSIECISGNKIHSDIAIIATGYSNEHQLYKINTPEYWDLGQFSTHENVSVSGSNDGGLIDTAFQFFGTKTIAVSRMLAYLVNSKPLKNDILAAEQAALELSDKGELQKAQKHLHQFYQRLIFEPTDERHAKECESDRRGTVTLYHRSSSPYSPKSAPVNKLLMAFCQQKFGSLLKFRQGEIKSDVDGNAVCTTLASEKIDPALLIVRHGAVHAAYQLLNKDQIRALEKTKLGNSKTLNAIVPDAFDEKLFTGAGARQIAPSKKHRKKDMMQNVKALVGALTNYLSDGFNHTSEQFDVDRNLYLVFSRNISPQLKAALPITTQSIKVVVESTDLVYSEQI